MNKFNSVKLAVVFLVTILGACSSQDMKPTAPVADLPSWDDFKTLPVQDQIAVSEVKSAELEAAERYNLMRYKAGDEVCYEGGSCIRWNRIGKKAAIFEKQSSGAWNQNMLAIATYQTDADGNIIVGAQADLVYAADQAGIARFVAEVVMSTVTAPLLNNVGAALISDSDCNGNNCGGPGVVNNLMNTAISEALSGSTANQTSNQNLGCASGTCP